MNFQSYKRVAGIKGACLALLATAGMASLSTAQTLPFRCGNDVKQIIAEYPEFWEGYQQFAKQMKERKSEELDKLFDKTDEGVRIIPVVVHVLHKGGTDNISKAQILSQLAAVNLDFRRQNSDKTNTIPYFDSISADCKIEFRLATKDPWGECTDGINRIYTDKTDEARDFSRFKQLSYWDRSKYLNIWLVRSIYDGGSPQTTLGYAQFPFAFGGNFPLTSTDGVTIRHDRFGTMGTAAGNKGRTMTHEVGHWLGLFHIWGDSECGDDQVDDTPISKEPNYGCYTFPKTATCINLTENSSAWDTIRRNQIGEMFNNYMDYSDDNCMNAFTQGQKEVIDEVLTQYQFRANLISEENLIATGTNDDAPACAPKPIADFWSRKGTNNFMSLKMICEGESILMENGTYGGVADTYDWSFPGGTPATSNAVNQNVKYETAGKYSVHLTATNAQGASAKTRTNYVLVSPTTADETNYIYKDDFESDNSNFVNNKWIILNECDPANGWVPTAATGYLSYKSIKFSNTNSIMNERGYLITPSYNLTAFTNDKLSFAYAYAQKTNSPFVSQDDKLEVYSSTDCGNTWTKRNFLVGTTPKAELSKTDLTTAGLYPNGFTPSEPLHWKIGYVDIPVAIANQSNVRFMFVWTSGGPNGNDFYFDEFQIYNGNTVSADVIKGQTGFKVFPNPMNADAQIYLNLPEESRRTDISLIDVTGRLVANIYSGQLEKGEQYFRIDRAQFPAAGMYFVQVVIDGKISSEKIVVQ